MRKSLLSMSALTLLFVGVVVLWSCGQLDPAQAPSTAMVEIVQAGEGAATQSWSVNQDLGVPSACVGVFRNSLINHCISVAPVPTCVGEEQLAQCCEARYNELEDDIQTAYRTRLQPGDCGYEEKILTAIVSRGSAGGTTDSSAGDTFNDMEVRWTTIGTRSNVCGQGVELWGVDEQPCSPVTPTALAEPYMDRTNDRGLHEIKHRWPIPVAPGSVSTYGAQVDIAVDSADYSVEVSVDELTEETETSDDDDDS